MLADEELPGSSEQSRSPRGPREGQTTASSPNRHALAAASRLGGQPPSPGTHRPPPQGLVGVGLSPQGSRDLGRLGTPPRGMRTSSGGSAVALPAPARSGPDACICLATGGGLPGLCLLPHSGWQAGARAVDARAQVVCKAISAFEGVLAAGQWLG